MTTASARPVLVIALAGVGALLAAAGTAMMLLGPIAPAPRLAAQFLGALLVSVAAGLLLVRPGLLDARAAVPAIAAAPPAWALGALTAASWGVGMDEADAGGPRSWFGEATALLGLGAWALGAIALLPVGLLAVRGVRSGALRVLLAAIMAVPASIAIGLLGAFGGGALLGGAAVIAVAALQRRPALGAAPVPAAPVPLTRVQRRGAIVSAMLGSVAGLGCAVFALTGSVLVPAAGDATETMGTGILAGSVAAVPVVLAGAVALRPRLGRPALLAGASFVGSLLALVVFHGFDQEHSLSVAGMLAAMCLAGLGGALLLAPLLPLRGGMRAMVVAAMAAALAATLGGAVFMATFAAPLLGVLIALLLARRPRAEGGVGRAAAA